MGKKRDRVEEYNHRWALRVLAWARSEEPVYGPLEALEELQQAMEEVHGAAHNAARAFVHLGGFHYSRKYDEISATIKPPGASDTALRVSHTILLRAIALAESSATARQRSLPS